MSPTNPPVNQAQASVPAWIRNGWRAWVYRVRRAARMTRRDLAYAADIDPSYITLFENGYVPKRHQVESVGRALQDVDAGLLAAGYLPAPLGVDGVSWYALRQKLHPEVHELIVRLAECDMRRQKSFVDNLRWVLTGTECEA